jgi:hypothetical protein
LKKRAAPAGLHVSQKSIQQKAMRIDFLGS